MNSVKLVTVTENEIRLNSNMNEDAFGKTNYSSIVTQTGVIATCTGYSDETKEYKFTFSPWSFTDVKSFEIEGQSSRTVFYCGNQPLGNKDEKSVETLLDMELAEDSAEKKERLFEAYYIICSILTQSAKEKYKLPIIGAGGIFISLDLSNKQNTQVLFLPENLYKYAAAGIKGKEGALLHGYWVNPSLFDLPALCFERAVFAYKMLTGNFPYPAEEPIERNADILDRNFLPLDFCREDFDSELVSNINKGLKLNSNEVNIPGRKKKGKSNEDLTPVPEFPLEKIYKAKELPELTEEKKQELKEKSNTLMKLKSSRINTSRKLRRNTATIITVLIVAVILGIITANTVVSRQGEPTSIGLTSAQTIEAFYKAANERDTQLMENLTSGKEPKRYTNIIANMYVIGKQRKMYNGDQGILSPEMYMIYNVNSYNNQKCAVYGVTHLKIDGHEVDMTVHTPSYKEKPVPLKTEKGISLNNKSKSVHEVEYYLLSSEGEDGILEVQLVKEFITLRYKKNHWTLEDIERTYSAVELNNYLFKSEYYNQVKMENGDAITAAGKLSLRYPWIPSKKSIKRELDHQLEMINEPLKLNF